ncbi:MAG TPA: cupredoxin domain-containing protein [Egibacteraceae bacterium]|nr:cupredoxin domain-containing protein [Egibacteraceae bacterium]
MRRALIGFAAALILAGCSGSGDGDGGSGDGGDSAGGTATITINDFTFATPGSVPAGTTVTVVNEDSASHTWTSTSGVFDSGNLAGGDSFSFEFADPGTYAFACSIHPTMTGSLTVE